MSRRFTVAIIAAVLLGTLSVVAQVKSFKPVTETMLRNPAPGDWLNWRRTDNAWGYSPLDQITRQNVNQLQLAWSWAMYSTGELQALDIKTGRTLWRHRVPSPINTAALTTAGGLMFAGDWDRHVYAYDASSGKILWRTRLPTSAQGFPIIYLARGKQYVAIPAGIGGGSWSTLIAPELAPTIRRPNTGNALLVFALP